MGLEVEVKRKAFRAQVAFVGFFTCVDQHVPLQLRVVQESLPTSVVGALKQLVAMHSVVLLQTGPVVENLPA